MKVDGGGASQGAREAVVGGVGDVGAELYSLHRDDGLPPQRPGVLIRGREWRAESPDVHVIEPVLGESGYIVPPPGSLPRLREITRKHGLLLVPDEVQTGLGRTGELFAGQTWRGVPGSMSRARGI